MGYFYPIYFLKNRITIILNLKPRLPKSLTWGCYRLPVADLNTSRVGMERKFKMSMKKLLGIALSVLFLFPLLTSTSEANSTQGQKVATAAHKKAKAKKAKHKAVANKKAKKAEEVKKAAPTTDESAMPENSTEE